MIKTTIITAVSIGSTATILYGTLRQHKKIIVFDIDNTLVHAKSQHRIKTLNMTTYKKCNFTFRDLDEDDSETIYDVWERPYLNVIIPLLSKFATLHIFTSADKHYADNILNNINITKYFDKILYDDSWDLNQSKDLKLVPGDSKDKILVDDRNFNNYKADNTLFYHIPSYRVHAKHDYELVKFFFKWMFVL